MLITVVLSGPKDMRTAAVIALMQQGWLVDDEPYGWGLAAEPDHTFIVTHGPSVDKAAAQVAHFGYIPRLHWEEATEQPIHDGLTNDEAIAALRQKLAELESYVRAIPLPES